MIESAEGPSDGIRTGSKHTGSWNCFEGVNAMRSRCWLQLCLSPVPHQDVCRTQNMIQKVEKSLKLMHLSLNKNASRPAGQHEAFCGLFRDHNCFMSMA